MLLAETRLATRPAEAAGYVLDGMERRRSRPKGVEMHMAGLGLDACVPEEVDLQRWHLRGLELRLEESERLRQQDAS